MEHVFLNTERILAHTQSGISEVKIYHCESSRPKAICKRSLIYLSLFLILAEELSEEQTFICVTYSISSPPSRSYFELYIPPESHKQFHNACLHPALQFCLFMSSWTAVMRLSQSSGRRLSMVLPSSLDPCIFVKCVWV